MPIEIRELHIRVAVNPEPGKQAPVQQNAPAGEAGQADKDAIIAQCVEEVLQILQAKKER
jgi:hypothetical protein